MNREKWHSCLRALIGLLILAGIIWGLFIIPSFMARLNPRGSEYSEVVYIALFILRMYLFNYLACFFALWLSGHLVHDDFLRNIAEAFITPVLLLVVLCVKFTWHRLIPDISLSEHYNMGIRAEFMFWTSCALLNAAFIYVLVRGPQLGLFRGL